MSKVLKIFTIFIFAISVLIYTSNAETTNLYNDIYNETTNSTSNSTTNENIDDNLDPFEDTSEEEISNTARSSTAVNAQINTVSSIPEANLGLNNVLCIILIAIGILIVLLAIAILIRLK